jgi:hypothetical protein
MEKERRWLSITDSLEDIKGKPVYSEKNEYMGKIVGENKEQWILDDGWKIHKLGSPNFYIED